MTSKAEYDMIVIGSIDRVVEIAKKYNVEIVKESFAKDDGYSFVVYEDAIGSHPLVKELRECKEVLTLIRLYTAMW